MVMAKTQIRSQIEGQNAQREKKIAQLNEFIARFSAGTRSSQVQSRRKEVERLQVTELAKSNIQRPFLKFEQKRPSGKHILELEKVTKSYGDREVMRPFTASVTRGEKIALMGRNGAGKTTLLNALLANSPTIPEGELRETSGYDGEFLTAERSSGDTKPRSDTLPRITARSIQKGMTGLRMAASVGSVRRHSKRFAACWDRCCFRAKTATSVPTFSPAEKPRGCSSASSCCRSRTCWCSTNRPTTSTWNRSTL